MIKTHAPNEGAWVQSQVGKSKVLHTLWYSQKKKKKEAQEKMG